MTADKAKSIITEALANTSRDCSTADYLELLGDLIDDMTARFNAASCDVSCDAAEDDE